jgi:hypothetical protein
VPPRLRAFLSFIRVHLCVSVADISSCVLCTLFLVAVGRFLVAVGRFLVAVRRTVSAVNTLLLFSARRPAGVSQSGWFSRAAAEFSGPPIIGANSASQGHNAPHPLACADKDLRRWTSDLPKPAIRLRKRTFRLRE